MTGAHVFHAALSVAKPQFLTAIGQKNASAVLSQRRRDSALFPAVGVEVAGSATPDEAHMSAIKVGDLVLPRGDDRPWRVLDLHQGKAQIEFVGEAWNRIKTVPSGDLRIDPCVHATTTNA